MTGRPFGHTLRPTRGLDRALPRRLPRGTGAPALVTAVLAVAVLAACSSPSPASVASGSPSGATGSTSTSVGASAAAGGTTASGACANRPATASIRAQVLAVELSSRHLQHVQPVPGNFFYGACAGAEYAATDYQLMPGATTAEQVALQDDGATMQYYRRAQGGGWTVIGSDPIPRDPRGCAAISAVPAALAAAWGGCPLAPRTYPPVPDGAGASPAAGPTGVTYLAASGWSGRSPVYRPSAVVLSGDSTLGLEAMRWTTWSATGATGSGVGWTEDCLPTCATGKIHKNPVTVTLTGSAAVCGHTFFTRMTLVWTGTVPTGLPKTYLWQATTPAC